MSALSPRTADLVGRMMSTLDSARGKTVKTDAVFEVLKMEAAEWSADHRLSQTEVGGGALDEVLAESKKGASS